MVTAEGMPLGIKVNTVNGTKGSIGSQYLLSCVMSFVSSKGGISSADFRGPMIEVTPKYYYNTYLDYKKFMVPSLIVIAVTMVTGFFPALNIVGEKQAGTIEQINVTPVKKTAFILCKLIPYWVITYFMIGMCFLIAWLVFGYVCEGSLWAIMFLTLLHIMVIAASA